MRRGGTFNIDLFFSFILLPNCYVVESSEEKFSFDLSKLMSHITIVRFHFVNIYNNELMIHYFFAFLYSHMELETLNVTQCLAKLTNIILIYHLPALGKG